MKLNADLAERAVVHAGSLDWSRSPMAGVERRMLDRDGGEVARATSIVRYAPGSRFSPHVHGGGEEFLVLDGVFEDEHGAYPAGSYIRNPPQSRHTPGSGEGCAIFVKLWQFDPDDREDVRLDGATLERAPAPGRPGVALAALHRDARERVRLEFWEPGADAGFAPDGGLEVLVLEGGFEEGGEAFVEHSWLRLPPGRSLRATAGPEGARVWVKEGHLADPVPPPQARG